MDDAPPAAGGDGDLTSIRLPVGLIYDLNAATASQHALDVLAKWLSAIIASDRASICVFAEDRNMLEVLGISGNTTIPSGTMLPVIGSAVGKACGTGEPHRMPVLADLDAPDAVQLHASGLGSAVAAPLVSAGECFGSLNLGRVGEHAFGSDDEMLAITLGQVVGSTLRTLRQIEQERIRARTDALTGLENRRSILDGLARQLRESHAELAVVFIDVDGFKAINDAYGHVIGDLLLQGMTERLRDIVGPGDQMGRIGGDEFLIVCDPETSPGQARSLAEHIADQCTKPMRLRSVDLHPRISIGLAVQVSAPTTVAELLAQADQAMYEAKRTGRSFVEVDGDLRMSADMLGAIDRDFEHAMRTGQITFHYQPLRDLRQGHTFGCEALIRWNHPDVGFVPPPLLIERAEATDRINALTVWGLDKVASDWAELRRLHPSYKDVTVAFNLSARQLGWSDYVSEHLRCLERHGLEPADLVVEVVESGQIEVETTAEKTLRELADRGVEIALDDFGTGHNVIGYFSRFPIHCIKVDKSMVQAMADKPQVRIVVKGLTQIARDLGIRSLGEGIETLADFDACVAAGIERGQGYLLARPMSWDALVAYARTETERPPVDSPSTRFIDEGSSLR